MVSKSKFENFIEELKELGCKVKELGNLIIFEKDGECLVYNKDGKELSQEEAIKIINSEIGYNKDDKKMIINEPKKTDVPTNKNGLKLENLAPWLKEELGDDVIQSNSEMGYVPNPADQIPAEPSERQ